jgi:hypothetical protein
MKKIRTALVVTAILVGAGASFASVAAQTADNTYYVVNETTDSWIVQSQPVSCQGGSNPCEIITTAVPDAQGEIPKTAQIQVLNQHDF